MAETRIAEAIDAVLVSLRASLALADPVAVYDGPMVSGDYARQAVFVGYDGDPEGEFRAADLVQAPTGPGSRVRDEQVVILGCAVAWSGDAEIKPLRDQVVALFAAVNAALRADHSQGLPNPAAFSLSAGALFQSPRTDGLQARLPFTITANLRV